MRSNWIRRSLRVKLIVFLVLAITVPMLSSIFITNERTREIVREDTVRQASNLVYQGKTNLTNYFENANQASLLPYNSIHFIDTLYRILEQGKTDYQSETEIYRAMISISLFQKDIHQVYLYAEAAQKSYLTVGGKLNKADADKPQPSVLKNGLSVYIEPSHESHDYGIHRTYHAPKQVITIHRRIEQIPSRRYMGMISIDITTDTVEAICSQLYDRDREKLYLISEDGTIVYGPETAEQGRKLEEAWVRELLSSQKGSGSGELKNKDFNGVYVYEKMTTNYMNWMLVKLVPEEVFQSGIKQVTSVNTMILGLFLILTIAAAAYVSFWITSPIKKLIGYVNEVQSGHMDIDIRLERTDEIGMLARRFRIMMETINNLILREYRLEIANKTNRLKALQAQVQPHFLYNALQSIGTLALRRKAPDIYSLISQLGKMMRYSMNTSEQAVTISQEIEHTKAYLALQQQRFGDKLIAVIDMQPETASCLVPRMIIQPLVENVFKHAFDPAGGQISLMIRTRMENGWLTIEVEDDGIGLTDHQLETISRSLLMESEQTRVPDDHIGLRNVLFRLQLYCSESSKLLIEALKPSGFRVKLLIPMIDEVNEH